MFYRGKEMRLAAIMYTDMVGYTSLGQTNESLSLELVEEQRRLIRPILTRHGGREVKTIGDAFLVEFSSALEATRCAYDIQRSIRESNAAMPQERKLHLRVGLHLGDVTPGPEGDIGGDAVNVASRIEALAEDGGVCLTRQVYDHVQNRFELPLESLGPMKLKNVLSQVEVFKIVMPWNTRSANAPEEFDKKRIAVLPFANFSPDPSDEYFSDGLTEEVIATMSRISGLKVIARTSVMGYKGGQTKISDVARQLEVGSVLEGSVRKVGERARITVQLIDVRTSEHLWSQSYDRELKDILAIQSDISETVAQSLKVQLLDKEKKLIEKKNTTVNPAAYTLYLKGRFYWNERTRESLQKALGYFKESVRIDPKLALGYSGLADSYIVLSNYTWMETAQAAPLAREFASKALELDDTLAEAHASLASTLVEHVWDFKGGKLELERAIQLRPNYSPAYHWYALLLVYVRKHEEALSKQEKAMELDPHWRLVNMGKALILGALGRSSDAMEIFQSVIAENPDFSTPHFWKSCLHVLLGEFELSIEEAKKALEIEKSSFMSLNLAWVNAESGRKEYAKELLAEVLKERKSEDFSRPSQLSLINFAIGNNEEGFRLYENGIKEKDTGALMQASLPWFNKYLFSDPRRLKEIEERTGLGKAISDVGK